MEAVAQGRAFSLACMLVLELRIAVLRHADARCGIDWLSSVLCLIQEMRPRECQLDPIERAAFRASHTENFELRKSASFNCQLHLHCIVSVDK
jgi:hypothetical protein